MKKKFNIQVDKDHYEKNYDNVSRFVSYFTQINEVLKLKPKNVLEIGIGNKTVSDYISHITEIKTLDFDKNLNPDFIGDVREIPLKDNLFDVVLCSEVLEHLPFEDVEKALKELKRVSKKYVIFSVPHKSLFFTFMFNMPKIKPKQLDIKIPFPLKHRFDGEHYWEIGKRGYPIKKIKEIIKKEFKIINDFRPKNNLFQHFFILEKI